MYSRSIGITADNSGLTFSEDGRRFAFAAGRAAKMWDMCSGRELKSWPLPDGRSDALAFDRLGKLLLLRWENGVCRLRICSAEPQQSLLPR